MTAKKLATGDLAANTNTVFGPVPGGKEWSFIANFCNRADAKINVRLAISATNTPALSEYYEYDAPVQPGIPLERTQLVAPSGYYLIVRAAAVGVSFNCHGHEE